MTQTPDFTPTNPAQQPAPTAYVPPQRYAPQPAGPPVKPPPSSRRVFWTRGPGVMLIVVAAGLILFGLYAVTGGLSSKPTASPFDITITSCVATGGDSLPMATVGFTVTNTGKTTRGATVSIEYRDGAGSRLDTDTSYVRSVAPGDTVRTEESTLLDAAPDRSMTCRIVGVS